MKFGGIKLIKKPTQHYSMAISVDIEKKLNDINWTLGWFDFASDVIVSNLTTLKEEFSKNRSCERKCVFRFLRHHPI